MHPIDDDLRTIDGEEMTAQERRLDAQLVQALERKPRVAIPEGFAARVAARASAMPVPAPVKAVRFGMITVVICAVLSAAGMLLIAPRTVGHDPVWIALQWVLCAQFCVLATWIGLARPQSD